MRILLLVLITVYAHAQGNWERIKIDEIISVELPQGFVRFDTLDRVYYRAELEYGSLGVVIATPPDLNLRTREEKVTFYEGGRIPFTKPPYSILSDTLITVDGLTGDLFVYEEPYQETTMTSQVLYLATRDGAYSFFYRYVTGDKRAAADEKEFFFNSVRLGDNVKDTEISLTTGKNFERGEMLGRVGQIVSGITLVAVIILVFLRKFRIVSVIKFTMAGIFVTWGVFNLLIFILNELNDNASGGAMISGFISLGIGIVLIVIKVPKEKK